jgi:exo-beta-1,3-glucanase (GH17 family)
MNKKFQYHLTKCSILLSWLFGILIFLAFGCTPKKSATQLSNSMTAKTILGNPDYQAISYGGYRAMSRDTQPTIEELKEDMVILSAMGIKVLRTYNVQLAHAGNVLKAIDELKNDNPEFEMYVMLGAWIDCKNAWTSNEPDHMEESEQNAVEIDRAVALANEYPDIVKIIAVGNEAMVKWAASYYVQPGVILKWVIHLQELKKEGKLNKDLWITSSDNFASWGGGSEEYHVEDLNKLIEAVDYISMHTYPMHDTHYNPDFWYKNIDSSKQKIEQIEDQMKYAVFYAESQYKSVFKYVHNLGIVKPIHIGETGWASFSDGFYGAEGSRACDEFKQAHYHENMRDWTKSNGLSCFYFQAFDEPWKDSNNSKGSENHFGLFTRDGEAKYAIWNLVDKGMFEGLTRGGNSINKTFDGKEKSVIETSLIPVKK